MTDLLHDTNFWVAISFIIFMIIAYKYGKDAVLNGLDGKIDAIKTELGEAERLRVDAQELLAEYQRKHKDALGEAEIIIAEARKHAEDIRKKAEDDMDKAQIRRQVQLEEKLNRLEQNAASEIQAYTAKIAINATREILKEKMDTKADKSIIANVVTNASKTLN